jgi:hypothetical protein
MIALWKRRSQKLRRISDAASLVYTTTILEQDKQFSLTLLAEGTGCCTYDWD